MTETPIQLPSTIVVRDLATKLGIPVTAVSAELIKNGVMAAINQEIDFDTAAIIAEDLGKVVTLASSDEAPTVVTQSIEDYLREDPATTLVARPPVVVVAGHVDHGKTSLLDAIRETSVTTGEAGGITQKIGAYQVTKNDRLITFIDTPGHEAFTQMRTRGAKVADVAILVVAADDGVKPQTKEALRIITEAGLPFLVAITKIDKPDATADKVKKELAEESVLLEGWGGQVPVIEVSAKTKQGVEDLLEAIVLLADVESDKLRVNPDRPAVGTIIESHVDPKQGPVASALVQTGTLRVGDDIVVGQVWGKVRSLKNDHGQIIKTALPSTPVQLLGLKAAPQVGDILRVSTAEAQELKKKVKSHQLGHHLKTVVSKTLAAHKEDESDEKPEVKKLFIMLKTDTLGSAEAILESLKKIEHPEVSIEIVQRGLGIISEADVLRAEAANAAIYGFNVQVSPKADQLARSKNQPIIIKTFTVIYDLIDTITSELEALLPPQIERQELGRLNVLAIFRNEHTFQVVGGKVTDGEVALGATVDVVRNGQKVATGTISQLQQNKQNAKTVSSGSEAGLKVEGQSVVAVGDTLVASKTISSKRTLQ
ncbi:MAG: translation initiation factor IF-2 [Candidatus Kerfeldbacteria bacterium]|nr:translation initiation factor IF-2 [Candidatus Kerfeldbacteria bacterium]